MLVREHAELFTRIADPTVWEAALEKVWGPLLARPAGPRRIWWPSELKDRPGRMLSQPYRFPDGRAAIVSRSLFEDDADWFVEVDDECREVAVFLPPIEPATTSDGALFFAHADAGTNRERFERLGQLARMQATPDATTLVALGLSPQFDNHGSGGSLALHAIHQTLAHFRRLAGEVDIPPSRFFDNADAEQALKDNDYNSLVYARRIRFLEPVTLAAKHHHLTRGIEQRERIAYATTPEHSYFRSFSTSPPMRDNKIDGWRYTATDVCAPFSAFSISEHLLMTVAEPFLQTPARYEATGYSWTYEAGHIPDQGFRLVAADFNSNVAMYSLSKDKVSGFTLAIGEVLPFAEAQVWVRGKAIDVMTGRVEALGGVPHFPITGLMTPSFLGAPVVQDGRLIGIVVRNVVEEFNHAHQPTPERLEGLAYCLPIQFALASLGAECVPVLPPQIPAIEPRRVPTAPLLPPPPPMTAAPQPRRPKGWVASLFRRASPT